MKLQGAGWHASMREFQPGFSGGNPLIKSLAHCRPVPEGRRRRRRSERATATTLKRSLQRNLTFGFGAAGVVLILVTAAACWNMARFQGTHHWVEHTREVLSDLEQARSDI